VVSTNIAMMETVPVTLASLENCATSALAPTTAMVTDTASMVHAIVAPDSLEMTVPRRSALTGALDMESVSTPLVCVSHRSLDLIAL
jgi:hypothetical protein